MESNALLTVPYLASLFGACCLYFTIERIHAYFYNWLGIINILGLPRINLVICTNIDFYSEQIYSNSRFWEKTMLPKFTLFYIFHHSSKGSLSTRQLLSLTISYLEALETAPTRLVTLYNKTSRTVTWREWPIQFCSLWFLEMWELGYNLREMKDRQALYSENDFWVPDGDRIRNLLMTGERL